jgi:hypothetical protein
MHRNKGGQMSKLNSCRGSDGWWATHGIALALAALGIAGAPAPAAAQLAAVSANPLAIASYSKGTAAAWDPVNQVYLVVGGRAAGTPLPLYGVFVAANGSPVTAPFQINTPGLHADFPRVVYSPDVSNGAGGFGGFLVTWNGGLIPISVHARVVAYPNRLVTGEMTIPGDSNIETGPAVAYSPASIRFLVVWKAGSAHAVYGAFLGTAGQLLAGPFLISEQATGARDPNLAWNPYSNEFGVVYTGWGPSGATTTFARVTPSGAVWRNTFNFAAATYTTDIALNSATGRYIAVWSQIGSGTMGAEITPGGDVIARGLVSSATGTYDGLGLSYNSNSGTFLLVGQGPSADIWGAELNSRGARTSADAPITSAGGPTGSFYPRAAARANAPHWNVTFSHNFTATRNQVIATFSSGGGPAGSLGSVPGGGGSTGGCPGTAPFPGAVCVNGGWVPGAGGGGTSGCPGTAPFPGAVCVNGGWVPGAGGGGTTGCPGTAPFPGAVCVNGGWVPGAGGGGSTGGCLGTAPFPGAVCVNGGWVPGSGGSTGGCTTPDPFTAIGGGTCVNGGWIPRGSASTGGSVGCVGTAPFPGAICVNGGWIPGNISCTGPDPFIAMGGGKCVNGGWVPLR